MTQFQKAIILADVELNEPLLSPGSIAHHLCQHVRALVARVDELEAQRDDAMRHFQSAKHCVNSIASLGDKVGQ